MEHCASDDLNGSWDFSSRECGAQRKVLWVSISTICFSLSVACSVWVLLLLKRGLRDLRRFHQCVVWVVEAMNNQDRLPRINSRQCEYLSAQCARLSVECQRSIAQCQHWGRLWKLWKLWLLARQGFLLQEFYCPVQKAYKLVEDCCAGNWLLKAVEIGNCREHFLEVLHDILRSITVLMSLGDELPYFDIEGVMTPQSIDETAVDAHREADSEDLIRRRDLVLREHGDGHYLADQLKENPVFFRAPPVEISKHVTKFNFSTTPLIYPVEPGSDDTNGPVVFRVMHSDLPFVIKMYWRKATGEEPQDLDERPDPFQREADIMRKCRHPYAVGLVGYWEVRSRSPKIPLLLMESMECNLRELIDKRNKPPTLRNMWRDTRGFPAQDAINLMLPVAKALRHMHRTRFVHRDIKPLNILYTHVSATQHFLEDISVKLADFGSAEVVVEGVTLIDTRVGTPEYLDPYLSQDVGADRLYRADRLYQADVFSFGLVFGEVLTGLSPAEALDCMCRYGVLRDNLHKKLVAGERPQLAKDIPQFVKLLVERCCARDSAARPSFEVICERLQSLRYS